MKTKYSLLYAPRFLKNMKTLDRQVQVRILKETDVLRTDPQAGKPLRGEWKGIYSLRVGDYRILYQIKQNHIILLAAGHRRRIYQ